MNKQWFNIVNKVDRAEVWIYEMIGEDFWTGGGVTAKNFQKELSEIKASQIDLHINSPGGQVNDGITIYNLLKQHPANITTYIDGWAGSIATVIALAGSKIIMAENGMWIVHNPSGVAMGTAGDMRSMADILDKIGETMIGTYVSKTKKTEAEVKEVMDTETWMTADEAKEFGFIDEISGEMDMAACAKFIPIMSKAGFKHIPKNLRDGKELPSEKELERALRDVGCSVKQAKTILAKGYSDGLRDVDIPPQPLKAAEPLRDVEPLKPARKDVAKTEVVPSDKHKTNQLLNEERFQSI